MPKRKNNSLTTPALLCLYPSVQNPTNKYESDDEEYRITLILDADHPFVAQTTATAKQLAKERMEEMAADAKNEAGRKKVRACKFRSPFSPILDDETGEPTGQVKFNVGVDASYTDRKGNERINTVRVFDAAGKPVLEDVKLGSGSTVRVSMQTYGYAIPGNETAGMGKRLKAVQIINLVTYDGGSDKADAYGFEAEDGFTADDSGFAEDFEADANPTTVKTIDGDAEDLGSEF